MGEMTDKLKAAGNKAAGKAKEVVGGATGDTNLEAQGDAQQLKADAQKVTGKIKGALGDDV